MLISELLQEVKTTGAYTDCAVLDVTDNTKNISAGAVFVCIQGARFDGHLTALEMEKQGAVLIVAERDTGAKNQVLVENSRSAYAQICAAFYGYPSRKLQLIGVTGTNGKTTTTMLLHGLLRRAGISAGLIGTVENRIGEKVYPASLTTPDCKDLHRLFAEMVAAGCTHCIMEVSSQALAQRRVDGCHFALALFTNLTQDHLDYHGTFQNYMQAKRMLFSMADTAILNTDDAYAPEMVKDTDVKVITFSANRDDSDYTAKNIICTASGVQYELLGHGDIGRVQVKIPGHFTVYNSMAAAVCAIESGISFEQVLTLLAGAEGVKGRVEVVPTDTDYTVLIDYAHSPDGLQNVISSLREVAEKRIITVFGCGGDRDRNKRPKMGKIVGDLSDVAVVTSDNPRTEKPEKIIEEILAGMTASKARIQTIPDRTSAIRWALTHAKKGDVVLLAGKGHETYQILNTGKIHYDEREIVADILKGKK